MRQLRIAHSITNREAKSLEKYLHEIGKESLIGSEEEVILARKIKKGDMKALDRLVRANLRFVVSVAKQYQNQGLSLPDLINDGNLGLIKAAGRYDETRGFKFISYAVWWIRQSIMKAISEQSRIVRIPLNQIGEKKKFSTAFSKLEQDLEREPSDEELSNVLNITAVEIRGYERIALKHVSVDAPMSSDENSPNLLDVLVEYDNSPEDNTLRDSTLQDIERALKTLTPREADVIRLFYGIGKKRSHTLEEIGEMFELSRERVRQIKDKAIIRLRHKSRGKLLKACLS